MADIRTLQIHVTQKCNLACAHCYSHSGPSAARTLDPDDLVAAISDAAALGYNLATISGGEPFLYPHLPRVLNAARAAGMATSAVTNGMFLDARRLAPLVEDLSFLVISLDGRPAHHNTLRANPRAFEVMQAKLPDLRASGIPFAFIMVLTEDNIDDLDWVADFAVAAGASALQIHPLDLTGRAAETAALSDQAPSPFTAIRATKLCADLQRRIGARLTIKLDYAARPTGPAPLLGSCGQTPDFAERVNPLCIETSGGIVPMGEGFDARFSLGQLGAGSLGDLAADWQARGMLDAYEAVLAETDALSRRDTTPPLINLAQTVRAVARMGGG